jgi:hypothetical protein
LLDVGDMDEAEAGSKKQKWTGMIWSLHFSRIRTNQNTFAIQPKKIKSWNRGIFHFYGGGKEFGGEMTFEIGVNWTVLKTKEGLGGELTIERDRIGLV